MKRRLTLLPLLALVLGCAPQAPASLRVHEALLYGQSSGRLVWVYGKLSGPRSTVSLAGQPQELLAPDPKAALYTPQSLRVGGQAALGLRLSPLSPSPSASVTSLGGLNYQVVAARDLSATYLLEGGQWQQLSGPLRSGERAGVQLQSPQGQVGQLSSDETSALGRLLAPQGRLLVTVLAAPPEGPLSVQPTPTEHLLTALDVQPLSLSSAVTFGTLASGDNAAQDTPSAQLANTQAALQNLWQRAYDRQSPQPPAPTLGQGSALGIFLGSRPTGGYGLRVDRVQARGEQLEVHVTVQAPGPRSIVTQAISSPWIIVSLSGKYQQARVIDQSGNVLASAQSSR